MWSLTLIPWSGGGYGLPQPLLSGGMLASGVGVGAGVGVTGGVGMGVVGVVAGVPPHAASDDQRACGTRTEEGSVESHATRS